MTADKDQPASRPDDNTARQSEPYGDQPRSDQDVTSASEPRGEPDDAGLSPLRERSARDQTAYAAAGDDELVYPASALAGDPPPSAAADAPSPGEPHSHTEAPPPPPPPRRGWLPAGVTLLGAATAGAGIALAVAGLIGLFTSRDNGVSALEARLGALELAVRDLAQPTGRPAPATDTRALDEVTGRVARLEAANAARPATPVVAAPTPDDPSLSNRLAGLEGEVKALGETIGALGRRSDDAVTAARDARTRSEATGAEVTALSQKAATANPATRSDLEAFDQRVAVLDRSQKALEAELAKSSAASAAAASAAASGDKALRLAFVASALRSAVLRGEPYTADLAAAKALGADPKTLAPLEPFAASGVPTADTLARDLAELAPTLRRPAPATPGAPAPVAQNFLQRLQANAEKLVRMRPAGEAEGDDSIPALPDRVGAMAVLGDVDGARAEIAKLPPAERAPLEPWIAKAQARADALEASRRLAADSLAGLGK